MEGQMREEYEVRRPRETPWWVPEGVKEEVEQGAKRGGAQGDD